VDTGDVEDATGFVAGIAVIRALLPTAKQAHWDIRDAQAHALIALYVKRTITPHIRFSKICKTSLGYSSWSLCKLQNEAKIALLVHKELESKIMHEEDEMDTFLGWCQGYK